MERQIQRFRDAKDKQITYTKQNNNYNKAFKQEFYLECMMIVYALLEDRCLAFLHHAGVLNRNSDKITPNKKVKVSIRNILKMSENDKFYFNKISGKTIAIRNIIKWSNNDEGIGYDGQYEQLLRLQIKKLSDYDNLFRILDEVDDWCKYRNELVHALMNKNYQSVREQLRDKVETGFKLQKQIDVYVKRFKYKNSIRRKMNL